MTTRFGLAVLGCLLALAAGGCFGSDENDYRSAFGETSTFRGLELPMPPLADRATPADTRRAIAIARRDRALADVLGQDPTFAATGEWRSNGGELLGVALDTTLARPTAVDADRPYVNYRADDAPDCAAIYRRGWLHEDSTGAQHARTLVDLHRSAVVSIQTDGTGALNAIPYRLEPECPKS